MALTEDQKLLNGTFLVPFQTPQQLKDWIFNFLGIDLPCGHIDPDSNSSPIEWLFEAYSTIRNNLGGDTPSFVVYAPREGYKTLACAALEVIAMCHFNLSVAHMAAIEPQSKKSVQYINSFVKKVSPYLAEHGMTVVSQNTRNLQIINTAGEMSYLTIIICTVQGANSEHTNLMVIDEVDVVRFPHAYEEAKLIPGMLNGRYPLTVFTSTRKFAFGMMQKEVDSAKELNLPVLHWNIIDITEKCKLSRHQPDKPKQVRYVGKKLPLANISEEEYSNILPEKQAGYDRLEAYHGCASCKLLPVCRMRLAHRKDDDSGGLYKPIPFTINQFGKVSPDMGEAQLMCWKPSSTGLIYPRFDETEGANVLTIAQAWESFTGDEAPKHVTLDMLVALMHQKGIPFYVGGDWGYRHNYTLIAGAVMPNGEFWIFENFAMNQLELSDMIKYAIYFRDKYKPKFYIMDPAEPSFMKTFRKNKMPCRDFTKSILTGIEAIRTKIVDATGRRNLKVLKTDENAILIKAFRHHHWKVDAQGNITTDPDDEEYADTADALRYMGQVLFAPKGKVIAGGKDIGINAREAALRSERQLLYQADSRKVDADILAKQIRSLAVSDTTDAKGKAGTLLWDFSSPLDE